MEFGQGFQSVAPSMPRPAEGRIKVEPKVESPEGGEAKEAVVTAEVKALVFVDSGEGVKADGVPGASGVITGIKTLQQDDFKGKLQPYLGKPATMATLNKISRDVIDYYRSEGFPVVNVVVPRQTVRDGVIQFVVTEAKVGKVIVEEVYLLGVCRFVAALRLGPRRGFERIRAALSDKEPRAERGVWAGLPKCGAEHASPGGRTDQSGTKSGVARGG